MNNSIDVFFSVIIPSYNRGNLLRETIDTVLAQEYKKFELIIIDDGSTDNTREVLDSYKDSRIRYIYQENAERSVARNNGTLHAKGKWICFLDSDDKYSPLHLLSLYEYISSNKIQEGLLFTGYSLERNGESIEANSVKLERMSPSEYFLRNPVNPTRVCINSSIAKKIKFRTDCIIVEDMIYWIELSKSHPVYQVPGQTAVYVLHDDNSVNIDNSSHKKMLKGLNTVLSQVPDLLSDINQNVKKQVFSDIYFGISRSEIFQNNKLKAFYYLFLSLVIDIKNRQTKHRLYLLVLLMFFPMRVIKNKTL